MKTSNPITKLLESRQWDIIIRDISAVSATLELDFFIIGAAARDIGMPENTNLRTTKDIDFAISITDKNKFYELKKILCSELGYREDGNYKLLHKEKGELDLVPFGEMRINYDEVAAISLNEEGLKEVAESGLKEIHIDGDQLIKVATLASITLLKLISWDDQKDHRTKDAQDINEIIEAYFDLHLDQIYEDHNDLFPESKDCELNTIGAQVLGRHIGNIIRGHDTLTTQIVRILTEQTTTEHRFAIRMLKNDEDTIDSKVVLLKLILKGTQENR
ncbi:MAG: hypothetical protein ACOYOA_05150 [Saprospiraceae bacterium]